MFHEHFVHRAGRGAIHFDAPEDVGGQTPEVVLEAFDSGVVPDCQLGNIARRVDERRGPIKATCGESVI